MSFEENTISIRASSIIPNAGYFLIDFETNSSWETCRERFNNAWINKKNAFGFSHGGAGKDINVASFIEKFEKVLNITSPTPIKSKFWRTDKGYCIIVDPDNFWKNCFWRSSLFSLLLRSGKNYNCEKDNFMDALLSESYAKNTELSIIRFLCGHTKVTHKRASEADRIGWNDLFLRKSVEEIRKILISDRSFFRTTIGVGSIWN